MNHDLLFYILGATVLTSLPFIGKYVSVVNTLLHEFGHALIATLLKGRVSGIELFPSTEGVAVTGNSSWLAKNLTSLAGYPFASFSGYCMIWAIKNGFGDYVLYSFFAIMVITYLFWIRNWYGLIWLVSFGAIMYYLLWTGNPVYKEPFLYILTAVVYVQSLYTSLVILYLSGTNPSQSGDAKNLSSSFLIVPSFVWGLLFAGQAIFFAYLGLKLWYS